MSKSSLTLVASFGGLMLALIGAGCTTTPVSSSLNQVAATSSVTQTVASTTDTVLNQATSSTVDGGSSVGQLISIQGVLPNFGTTTLTFVPQPDHFEGTYVTAKEHGMIYGTNATTTERWNLLLESRNTQDVTYELLVQPMKDGRGYPADFHVTNRSVSFPVYLTLLSDEGRAKIQIKTQEKIWKPQPNQSCHVSLEYPIILANSTVSQAQADRINQAIRTQFGETATSTIDDALQAGLNDCIADQEDMPLSADEADEMSMAREFEDATSVLVTRNERGLLSLLYTGYSYTGGAHPNSFYLSQTFDLATGKELSLRDLVRPEAVETWIQREEQRLLRQDAGNDWLFDKETVAALASGKLKGAAASSTPAYQSLDQWYLSNNTLVRYYQSYEIEPYAAGIPTVDLPFSAWQDLATLGAERWFR